MHVLTLPLCCVHQTQEDLFVKICEGDFEFNDAWWSEVSQDAKDLISGLQTVVCGSIKFRF